MSHGAQVVQVLLSGPSDLPDEHRNALHRAMRVWNFTHGRIYGIHYSATDWHEGGSPAFGEYAQAVLNDQIVDDSDTAIVILSDRLGTPTPSHASGTVEEVSRLLDAGKQVAIFVNDTPRSPLRDSSSAEERNRLDSYIADVQQRAYVEHYRDLSRLAEVVDLLLSRLASQFRHEADEAVRSETSRAQSAVALTSIDSSAGVWPRTEVRERPETDSNGRLRTRRDWYLVLESSLEQPVRNVAFRYEDADGNPSSFDAFGDDEERHIEILGPRASATFPIYRSIASSGSAMCVVSWTDQSGTWHETRASVRA